MTKLDEALMRVLDVWPGTPEELGVTLGDATREHLGGYYTAEFRRQWHETRVTAQARLRALPGGLELMKLEVAWLRRNHIPTCDILG